MDRLYFKVDDIFCISPGAATTDDLNMHHVLPNVNNFRVPEVSLTRATAGGTYTLTNLVYPEDFQNLVFDSANPTDENESAVVVVTVSAYETTDTATT